MSDDMKDTALKITEEIVKLADDITMLHGINREAAFQFAITATLISAIENLRTLFTTLSPDQGTQN